LASEMRGAKYVAATNERFEKEPVGDARKSWTLKVQGCPRSASQRLVNT